MPADQPPPELERHYRRLLRAYPPGYRDRRGDEIVTTLLESAAPGQTRPTRAERADLYAGAVRERLGLHAVRDLGPALRIVTPVLLVLVTAFAVSGWSGDPFVPAQRGVAGIVVAGGWLLAVVVRLLRPRAALPVVASAWVATVVAELVVTLTGQSTVQPQAYLVVRSDLFAFEAIAGLVVLVGMATVAGQPSIVERLVVPVAVGGLATVSLAVAPSGWMDQLWLLPALALLAGIVVRVRTGSAAALWAAVLLLPLVPYGLDLAYVHVGPVLPALYAATCPCGSAAASMLVNTVLVATIVGLAATGATRGPARSHALTGSLSLGAAAGLSTYLALDAAYHGDAAWGTVAAAVLSLLALVVAPAARRVLAAVAMVAFLADSVYRFSGGTWLDAGTVGALTLLLLVAAATTAGAGRRAGLLTAGATLALAVGAITIATGTVAPQPYGAGPVLVGIGTAFLVPVAYWAGRRVLFAPTAWAGAVPAFVASVLWISLLIGPAYDAPSAIAVVVAAVVAVLLARLVRRRATRLRAAAPLVG